MSQYKRIGDYVQLVDERNRDLQDLPLMGLSITKKFIPSIANTIGTNMSTYKIVRKNQFAYSGVTSRNGDKITIALFRDHEKALVSQAYTPFEVIDTNKLLPEYLMMWFSRPEFDRYARFKSHGSAREIFDWGELCDTLIPVPSIDKQEEIVKEYNVVQDRIALNNKLIKKLEETAQAIYKQWFVDFEFPDENGQPYKSSGGEIVESELGDIPKGWVVKKLSDFCDIKGGKRLPKGKELNDSQIGNPYIKVADMSNPKFIVFNEKLQFVDDITQKSISKYIVSKGDIIISIVGTIGLINVIDETLNKANLTENCVKLTNLKNINSDFIYHYLSSSIGQRIIETKTVGGVQGKLPLYNIQSIPIILSDQEIMGKFERFVQKINSSIKNYTMQNSKLSNLRDLLLSKLAIIEN